MERNFRYIKKNQTFICENNVFKIEFSKPVIKGFKEFSSINLSNGNYFDVIENCTYTMKIFKSLNEEKWKSLNEVEVNGFGIFQFQKLIKEILHQKKISCQRSVDENGYDFYSYLINNKEYVTEDFYEIRKIWNADGSIVFNLFVGFSMNDVVFNGIHFQNLSYQDILIWKKCIDDFIHYAILIHNQKIRTFNKLHSKHYFLKDGRIYASHIDNYKKLENIFVEKEETVTVTEINFSNKETFFTIVHKNVVIEKVTPKYILLDDGSKIKSGRIFDIQRFFDKEDDRFQFGVNGVANDFIYAITINDRDDFENLSDEELLEKYGDVFINRTYVGHELHPISTDINTFKQKVLENLKKKIN